MSRAKLLLAKGYFPSQLPPSFTCEDFSNKHLLLKRAWAGKAEPRGLAEGPQPEPFSVARAGHSRRTTALVNPVTQLRLSEFIANHWRRIEKTVGQSSISLSKPLLQSGGRRAIDLPSSKHLLEKRLLLSPGYKYALVTDISQFFPTLYTHSIAWAIYGKAKAKANRRKPNIFGNKLDSLVQRCQSRQTLGIPIGPDTSHIVAELIACAIDKDIVSAIKTKFAGYRYVDDYLLFFQNHENAAAALAAIEAALRRFELKINTFKTKIVPIAALVEDSWTHDLRAFSFSPIRHPQKRDLNHFFDLTFSIALANEDENVLKFALRKLSSFVVKRDNWPVFQAHLCKAITNFPNCIQEAAHIFYTYHLYGFQLDDGLGRTLNLMIEDHAPLEHHSEIAWALWMCREFRITLSAAATKAVSKMNSSVALLLALDLRAEGLLAGRLDKRSTRRFATPEALYEGTWLLSYEGGIRNWIYNGANHIAGDPYFLAMQNNDIHFYRPERRLAPLFVRRGGGNPDTNWFDEDREISDRFDFTDVDVEYQDLPTEIFDPFDPLAHADAELEPVATVDEDE
jgi:hypothetical protein